MTSHQNNLNFYASPAEGATSALVTGDETYETSGLFRQFISNPPHAFTRAWCQPFPFVGYPTLAKR
jgi:hypothetical protein